MAIWSSKKYDSSEETKFLQNYGTLPIFLIVLLLFFFFLFLFRVCFHVFLFVSDEDFYD